MKAYVLAGGESRRMGRDKRAEDFGGEPMLGRVIATVSSVEDVDEVVLVTRNTEPTSGAIRSIRDVREERGPLSGLEAALQDALPAEQCLILACDYPLVRAQTLRAMIGVARRDPSRVTLVVSGETRHPLVAVWPTSALPALRRQLAEGDRRVLVLIDAVGFTAISDSQLEAETGELENVNDPDDLSRARRIDAQRRIQPPR